MHGVRGAKDKRSLGASSSKFTEQRASAYLVALSILYDRVQLAGPCKHLPLP